MASLLPLLHDLLPIFMPAKIQIARRGDLVAVAERAERPPWYQQKQPPVDAPAAGSTPPSPERDSSVVLEPIRLLDFDEGPVTASGASADEEGPVTGPPGFGSNGVSVPAPHRDGPRVFRRNAMVGVSDKMCVTVLTVQPRSASAIHHHGEQDTIIYATTAGVLLTSPSLDTVKALRADIKGEQPTPEEDQPRRFELGIGDFAFVPAWTEHQVVNEAPDGDVSWVLFRGGGEPVQVDLDGWGGGRIVG